tara:strand:- start:62 stop:709 length:648 start_codon:yes stop_codon:yes gene_type:complete
MPSSRSPKVSIKRGILSRINRSALATPSLDNQYQVTVNVGGTGDKYRLVRYINQNYGVNQRYILDNVGVACYDATLPTSSFATAEVKDNFHGINQQFAHTRLYVDSDFSFYVDNDYNVLKFFEGWMDFITSGGSASENDKIYYRRMQYPSAYKCDGITITKFDKNIETSMTHRFINAFPKSIQAIPVKYGPADVLRVTVTFAYDRYILHPNKDRN